MTKAGQDSEYLSSKKSGSSDLENLRSRDLENLKRWARSGG
jgi:hypothetical protein